MNATPRIRLLPTALLVTLALVGCGSSEQTGETGETAAAPSPAIATEDSTYPVTVENCGREVTFTEPPQRIVSGWITGTELLIELGAADRIVGLYNTSAFSGPRPEYAEAYGQLEVLSETAPTRESLIAAEPDLIYADGNYLFDGTQQPTVEELAESGINVIVLSGFCDDGGASAVTDINEDLAALGPALGVQPQAEEIAADVQARLDAVVPVEGEVSIAPISVFDGQVFTYEGVYTDIIERAGGQNANAGVLPEGTYFGELSVEDLTNTDPDTILYLLSSGETEAAAEQFLVDTFPTVSAVTAGRVIYLPQEDSSNLRGVEGVEVVAQDLADLG